jgi:hypothetical protein
LLASYQTASFIMKNEFFFSVVSPHPTKQD